MLAIAIAILSGAFIGYGLGLRTAHKRAPTIRGPLIVEAWGAGVIWSGVNVKAKLSGLATESPSDGFLAWAKSKGVEVAR